MKKTLIMVLSFVGLILILGQASAQTARAEEVVCGQWRRAYCSFSGANTPVFQPCGSSQLWVPDPMGAYSLFQEGQFVRLYSPRVSYDEGFECEGQKAGYLWTARLSEPINGCSACFPVQTNPPAGYTFCANEGERCSFAGVADVAYGANGQFNYQYGIRGGIDCNNAVFGDPIVGVRKACYIKIVASQPTPVPYPPPTPRPTSRPTPTAVTKPIVQVRSTTVNLRSGPGTDYSVIGRATPGAQLPITGKNSANDWWQVCCVDGQRVWVAARVVDAHGPLSQVPVVPASLTELALSSTVLPLHKDCLQGLYVTVTDLPKEWQPAVLSAAQTWNRAGSRVRMSLSGISPSKREFVPLDDRGNPINWLRSSPLALARCEIRVIPASSLPDNSIPKGYANLVGWVQPYRLNTSPKASITSLVILNDKTHNWSTGGIPRLRFDVETIALHELGHALGLGHIQKSNILDLQGPVMSGEGADHVTQWLGFQKRALTEADIRALIDLYGK